MINFKKGIIKQDFFENHNGVIGQSYHSLYRYEYNGVMENDSYNKFIKDNTYNIKSSKTIIIKYSDINKSLSDKPIEIIEVETENDLSNNSLYHVCGLTNIGAILKVINNKTFWVVKQEGFTIGDSFHFEALKRNLGVCFIASNFKIYSYSDYDKVYVDFNFSDKIKTGDKTILTNIFYIYKTTRDDRINNSHLYLISQRQESTPEDELVFKDGLIYYFTKKMETQNNPAFAIIVGDYNDK